MRSKMTKILLVEDDKSLSEIYDVRLRAEGYDILSASDGEQALALAIKEVPDLIISDVMMPNISGFDMLDILRSTTETRGIHVIMMTALSSDEQRQRGMALGADRYLIKSQVGIEDVVRTVHEVLGDASVPSPAPLVNEQAKRATIEPGPGGSKASVVADSEKMKTNTNIAPDKPSPELNPSEPIAEKSSPSPSSASTNSAPVIVPSRPATKPTSSVPVTSNPPVTPAAPVAPGPMVVVPNTASTNPNPNPNPTPTAPVNTTPATVSTTPPAPITNTATNNAAVDSDNQAVTSTTNPAPQQKMTPPLQQTVAVSSVPNPSTLPQPIAPFSTNRPGSSGRIIQPITPPDQSKTVDYTARMSEELANYQDLSNIPAPQVNPVFPAASAPTVANQAPTPQQNPVAAPSTQVVSSTPATTPPAQTTTAVEPALTASTSATPPANTAISMPAATPATAPVVPNNTATSSASQAAPAVPAVTQPSPTPVQPTQTAPGATPTTPVVTELKFEETTLPPNQPK